MSKIEDTKRGYTGRRILSAVILFVLLLSVLIGCGGQIASEPMDYSLEDMTKYAKVNRDTYYGKTVTVSVPPVMDIDVENAILTALKENRGTVKEEGAINGVIYAGDDVTLWQRGYIVDEKGFQWDFEGGSNLTSGSATTITVGSGSETAKGLEFALVGVVPSDHGRFNTFHKITEGEILDTDVVYVTTQCFYETGRTIQGTLRIDLRRDDVEEQYGEGIVEYLKGLEYGEVVYSKDSMTLKGTTDSVTYYSIRLDYVTRCENDPYVIEAKFPDNYSEETLAGKTVYFDTYIKCVKHYSNQPTLTEEFIKDTLKFTDEDLKDYEGETVVEKYRNCVRASLEYERELEIIYEVENSLFSMLLETVEYKKLPKAEMNRVYSEYLAEYRLSYSSSQDDMLSYYDGFDDFMVQNLLMEGLLEENDTDWEAAFKKRVEQEIKEKIALFSIIQYENWLLSDEEYAELYRDYLESGYANDASGGTREDFDSEEKYQQALKNYEQRMINYYGEWGIKESIYFNYALAKIRESVTVINTYD